jgi:hypothetical protein
LLEKEIINVVRNARITRVTAYLALLKSQDSILYGIRNDESLNIDCSLLAEPMDSIERLRLDGLTPAQVEGDNA